jgi:hypothetical protein
MQRNACLLGLFCWTIAGAALAATQVPPDRLPAFVVPRIAKAPVIDGRIDPEEWKGAMAVSGVAQQNPGGNLLVMRSTTYFLGWDADNLYLACRTWIMPGYAPRVAGRAPGTVNAFDDGMEFGFKPMGRNVAEGRADSLYKFFISCFGSDGDLTRVSVGQMFRNWQPRFKTATRLTPPGSAPLAGRWWECEMVLPAKDFELVGPNRAGDRWKMLLAFNHIPGWMQAAIPINSAYFDASGHCEATLVDNAPAVQVTMDDLPGPLDGVASVRFQVYNPTPQPIEVKLLAQYVDLKTPEPTPKAAAEAVDLLKREQVLAIGPGKTAEFKIHEKLPGALGKNAGGIYYRVTYGNQDLYRYYTYFKLGYDPRWTRYTPPQEAFPLAGTFNPARNNFRLQADTYYLDKPESAKQLRYRITRQGDSKAVAEGLIDKLAYCFFTRLLPLPDLTAGTYNVEAVMETHDGRRLGPVTVQFKKLDEARAFAPWWKNNLGNTERVIWPFEPTTRQGNALTLCGRRYRLNAVGMPAEIVSQGRAVSAAPARIVVVQSGRETVIPLDGALTFTEERPWRMSFQGKAAGAGLTLTAHGCVEQDGLAVIDLTYAPAGKGPVQLDALRLEFPLSPEDAECLLCIGPGGNFSSLSHLVLPKDKQGRLWSTLDTGRGGSSMTVGSFYPDVWIGNERRGFLWWADSDQGWVPDDDVPAHEVLRAGSQIVLRNNLIGKPYTLDQARTVTFSYNASPFKPLPKGWRMAIHSEDGTFGGPHKNRKDPKTGAAIDGWHWLHPPSYDPGEWSGLWAEYKKIADEAVRRHQPFNPAQARNHTGSPYVHTSLPLTGYGAHSADGTVTGYFEPEWGSGNFTPTMRDYVLWLADRSFREGGLRTIYWDIFYVTSFNTLQSGYGYELPDGRIQPTFHGFNLRKFMMRLYALMGDHRLTPGSQVAHATNAYPLLAFPWIDAVLDGEWAEIYDSTTRDWVDYYPVDRMRVMSIAQNFGVQVSWMSLFRVSDRKRYDSLFRQFMDYQRLHDTWTGQDGRYPPRAVLDWGVNDPRLQFVPYWRNTAVTSADKELLVSLWRLPDRVLMVVFNNNGKQSKDAALRIDLSALGLGAGERVARELGECGDPEVQFDAAGQTLRIPGLQPHTARYVGVRVHQPAEAERLRKTMDVVGLRVAEIPAELIDWGWVSARTMFFAPGHAPAISADKDVRVALWQMPDRVLLAVTGVHEKGARDATIGIDLDALQLAPKLPWQEFVRVRTFTAGAPETTLDFHGRKLLVPKLQPGELRLIGVRRH